MRGEELRQEIGKIIRTKYNENLQCVPCANAIKKYLRNLRIPGRRIKLDTPKLVESFDDFIMDNSLPGDEAISNNGHHEGIGIAIDTEEIVFDNHHPEGVPIEQWSSLQN